MADEPSQDQTSQSATPNRDRRHEPPIIEGSIDSSERDASAETEAGAAEERTRGEGAKETEPTADVSLRARADSAAPPHVGTRAFIAASVGALVGAAVAATVIWLFFRVPALPPDMGARLEDLQKNPPATAQALGSVDKRVGALESA